MIPTRVQRSRAKSAKQPPNTRYCGRGTKYGNEHVVEYVGSGWWAVDGEEHDDKKTVQAEAVDMYIYDMQIVLRYKPEFFDDLLKYEHLSCFCPLDMPCHVDAIIEHLKRREAELSAKCES